VTFARTDGFVYNPQYARPDEDQSLCGSWSPSTGGDLWEMLNEIAFSDADFIRSPDNPTDKSVVLGLTAVEPPPSRHGHRVSYRFESSTTGSVGVSISLTVELLEGDTQVASWTHNNVAAGLLTYEQLLTTAQASTITNYGNLFLRFSADTA